MNEALGVNPTQRMVADAKLAGVVGDDDGLSEQALGFDRPRERRFAGHPHRIGRHPQVGDAERAQVAHPLLMQIEGERRMAGEVGDDILRQIGAAHVGDRRRVDDVAGRAAEQTPRKAKRDFPAGAERGEPVGADVGGETAFAGMARAGVVHGDEGRAPQPRPQHRFILGAEILELGGQKPHHLALGDHQPRPVRSATILSQVIWP